ncbi:bifunctional metallophosphatase/5'-nucleotidase [Ornithinibacillus sp. L9]|uniref:Bifunctional metallophosphatase/5'-nucleotidase n=1 Tax=Ornithinibacillus caprae TaxID=2678566 RepID=A0A6N8FPA2_9BACI|nr:bifunctional UDP-sugar hydrolase/5'-nucleotidase [Ornithinibacillus caprae]MUK89997.1 bifunctional metallophosphatase/5'-nucleotidase [Ornithinibacillus caprae]
MQEKLYFYYTNDLHSDFEQWPRVAAFMKEAKANKEVTGDSCWIVDIGDHVDRVHPIAEAFMGKANVQLMNELDYDIATIGNNEGITLAHHDLFHLYDEANFQVVCANLHSLDGVFPKWLNNSVIIESKQGTKVGVIGLTAPFNDFYELLDWHVSDPYEALAKHLADLKEKTDIIVILSHLGISEDQEIARRFPAIDVIIGGHTHHLLRTGEKVNNSLITAAGKHCAFVGEVILTWDLEHKVLVDKEAYATDITHISKDVSTVQRQSELELAVENILGETVIQTNSVIEVKWFQHTPIMQRLTDKVRTWTKADCAMLNSGLLLDDFPIGNVTYKDIHRICPHPINPCVVELSGNELIEVTRASFTKEFTELKLKGFGFRGEIIGRMVFSGLKVETDFHDDGQEFVKDVTINGQAIEKDKIYTVATADTFTFGRLLPEIAKSKTKNYFVPEFLRDLLAETLREYYGR